MKNKNDLILKYIAGKLSERQTKLFEKELERSDSLRTEYYSILSSLEEIKNIKNIRINSDYFDSLTYKVHEKIIAEKYSNKKRKIQLASVPVLLIVLFAYLFLPFGKKNMDLNRQIENISDSVLIQVFNNDELNALLISDADIIDSYNSELIEKNINAENIGDYEIENDLIDGIDEEELISIFNKISNKSLN